MPHSPPSPTPPSSARRSPPQPSPDPARRPPQPERHAHRDPLDLPDPAHAVEDLAPPEDVVAEPVIAQPWLRRRRWLRRFGPLAAILLMLATVLIFDLHRHVSFETLRTHRAVLVDLIEAHLALAALAYLALYIAAVTLSLPVAAVLSISGGFLFGFALGGALAVSGATLGAILIFLAARTALGDSLRRRAGPWLHRLEAGFQANAFSYLMSLRLMPLLPFWLVNLVPALLGVPLRTFALATLLGSMPAILVFASVGNGMGAALDRGDAATLGIMLSPEILLPLLALAALSLLPVLVRMVRSR